MHSSLFFLFKVDKHRGRSEAFKFRLASPFDLDNNLPLELLLPRSDDPITSIQRQEFKARRALMELDLFRIKLAMEPSTSMYDKIKNELDRLREMLESPEPDS
jgi:hypothetical protein